MDSNLPLKLFQEKPAHAQPIPIELLWNPHSHPPGKGRPARDIMEDEVGSGSPRVVLSDRKQEESLALFSSCKKTAKPFLLTIIL
jgi:hypothetical protein